MARVCNGLHHKRHPISCQKRTELQTSCLRKGRRNTHAVKRNHKSGDPMSVCAGARLCVHHVRTKQVLDARRHGGTLVQKALSPVPVNQTSPLHRRERRGDSPSVVTLLGQTNEHLQLKQEEEMVGFLSSWKTNRTGVLYCNYCKVDLSPEDSTRSVYSPLAPRQACVLTLTECRTSISGVFNWQSAGTIY